MPGQTPPDRLRKFVGECGALVSSTRRRAIQSARTMVGEREFPHHEILIEAPLPPPNVPAMAEAVAQDLGFLRPRSGGGSSTTTRARRTAPRPRPRADQAAAMLIGLAGGRRDRASSLAHGFFNHLIGRSLKKLGWKLGRRARAINTGPCGAFERALSLPEWTPTFPIA